MIELLARPLSYAAEIKDVDPAITAALTPLALADLQNRLALQSEHDLMVAYTIIRRGRSSTMSPTERDNYISQVKDRAAENRWREETGVEPRDTRFILGTPIYNETHMGPGVLATSSTFADIPLEAHVDHVYVTNRCTDGSEQMVREHMSQFGDIEEGLPVTDLGDFSFDNKIDGTYSMVRIGNHRLIHVNTHTGSKANVWRILTEMAVSQEIPIVMSHDANVSLSPDGPKKLYAQAYRSFIQHADTASIISAVTPEYVNPDVLDPLLQGDDLSPRQLLPFGLLVPKQHQVNGKFAAWDPYFYSDRSGRGLPLSKLDDVVMAKQANRYGRTFRHMSDKLSFEWGVSTINGRLQQLARYTTGYFQMAYELGLIDQTPELRFFEDSEYRHQVLRQHAQRNPLLESHIEQTILLWDKAIQQGLRDYRENPKDPSFEGVEGAK